jgi:hypothetical protein
MRSGQANRQSRGALPVTLLILVLLPLLLMPLAAIFVFAFRGGGKNSGRPCLHPTHGLLFASAF